MASPRPASVPEHATFDSIDKRWVFGAQEDGARKGEWRWWREDGSLYRTAHYEGGGLIHGVERYHHPDGSLAEETRWVHGIPKESTSSRGENETDFELWKELDPRVMRLVRTADERGWRTSLTYDRAGVEVTTRGEPVPKRPKGVPATARYVQAESQSWQDWTSLYTTNLPVGRHRSWTPKGELLEETEYTTWGRRIWQRAAAAPDPQVARIDAFIADPITFSPAYQLGQHWTTELHDSVRVRLRKATSAHVAAYLDVLGKRIEWHLAEGVSRSERGLDIVDDWLGRNLDDAGTDAIYAWAIEHRLDLHDRDAVAALLARGRALLEKSEQDHAELLERAAALAKGKTDREIDAIAKRLTKSRAEITAEDVVRLARRSLRVPELQIWLGDASKGELLLRDELGRFYVFDGKTFAPAPLAIDTSERRNAVHFLSFDTCDERRLYLSGQHVWWTFTRYGWTVHLQGSHFFSSRGQGESILSGLVRCPDSAWVERVRAIFRNSLPSAAAEVGPFQHVKKGLLFAWAWDASIAHRFGHELSRGVDDKTFVNTTRQPGVLRLELLEKKKGVGTTPVTEYGSAEEAIERFNRVEMKVLRHGYRLDRVVALPISAPDKKEKTVKPAAPSVTRDLPSSVREELLRSSKADDLGAKIEALRTAWAKRPVTALADAIDTLSTRAPAIPEIVGKAKAALAQWDALEKKRDPAMLGPLLASLTDAPSTVVQPRLDRLVTWPMDPRLDRALMDIAWNVPFTSSGTQGVWRRIYARLRTSEDARILERLRELPKRYKKVWARVMGVWAREVVESILAERTATLEALKALTLETDDQALLAKTLNEQATNKQAMSKAAAGASGHPIAKILAGPDDLELRLAYARAAGPKDIRAEHILLSSNRAGLDKTGRARLATIERDHGAELAGPIFKYLKKGARFDRGFLVAAELMHGKDLDDAIASSPWWATVEELDVGLDAGLQGSTALVSLRALRGVVFGLPQYPATARIDASPVRPRVTTLDLSVHKVPVLGDIFRSDKLPALEELTFALERNVPPHLGWLDLPATQKLTSLTLIQEISGGGSVDRTSIDWLAGLWKKVSTSHPNLRTVKGRIEYGEGQVHYRLERAAAAGTVELSVRCASNLHGWMSTLQDNVRALIALLETHGRCNVHLNIKNAPDDFLVEKKP